MQSKHHACMCQRPLTLAFLKPNPLDHWVNRLTASVSEHPVCHVELFFESLNQCFSILWGGIAGFKTKSLSNPNYVLVTLSVTSREYETCLDFCRMISMQNIGFDEYGMWQSMYTSGCCSQHSQSVGSTFCSKIITEALQHASVDEVEYLVPACTTPSRLYSAIRRSRRLVCNSVPFKRQALLQFASST